MMLGVNHYARNNLLAPDIDRALMILWNIACRDDIERALRMARGPQRISSEIPAVFDVQVLDQLLLPWLCQVYISEFYDR